MPDAAPSAFRAAWRNPALRWGLALVVAVFLAGVYAPFLAGETPLVRHDAQGLSFPIFADLFNRQAYGKPYDLVFNLLALLLPGFVVLGLILRRWSGTARAGLGALALLIAVIACAVPFTNAGPLWRNRALPAASPGAWQVLPPIPWRFDTVTPGAVLKAPGDVDPATGRTFYLGTDSAGKDVAAQMIAGARISLTVGFVAAGLSLLIGLIIGAVSGYYGGWVDLLLQRVVEIMMCFPTFILIIVVVAMLSRDIFLIMTVIGLTGWAGAARLVRGEFLAQSVRDYVTAGECLGLSKARIMFRHILPNALTPLVISATFGIAGAVGAESGLSFLGLGDPTVPSWGSLLEQGRENIRYPWLIYVPGGAIFFMITALNLVGNGLREAFDPHA